ncbi:MAG: hypothetical protein FWH36_09030 [Lentimicrobiaceae bacterium]|nr:hypothetical protein [Lentimicrobiaceae bacterium]
MRDKIQASTPMGSIFENGLHGLSRQRKSYEQHFVDNFFPNRLFFSKKGVTTHSLYQKLVRTTIFIRLSGLSRLIIPVPVIASGAKQSRKNGTMLQIMLDCFFAALIAMTEAGNIIQHHINQINQSSDKRKSPLKRALHFLIVLPYSITHIT